MNNDNLKQLLGHALAAMKAGSDVAARATDEISGDASHPDLKAALEKGNQVSRQWAERIERARQHVGEAAPADNPVLEAQVEVSQRIRQHAPDDVSRDLGIIANGQSALHYWISVFGTAASYTSSLGMDEVAGDMKMSADEAKAADAKYSQVAERILADA